MYVIPAWTCAPAGIYARRLSKLKHIRIHHIVNHLKTVMHTMSLHATLQVEADRHNELGIIGDLDNLPLQLTDQNVLVLRLVNGPMLGKDVFVAKEFLPKQGYLPKWVGDVQMNQIGIEKVLLDVFQAILVHPQHFEFANGVDLWRTDVDLHVGVVCSGNLLDLERFRHVLAVADGKDDGMAILRQ